MSEAIEIKSPLLTKTEASKILRVAPITVHRMMRAGLLGYHRIGARVFTSQQLINEYLENNTRRPRAA